ncbi:MAG: ATP-binding protein [Gemmatimonadaceae bacterium]
MADGGQAILVVRGLGAATVTVGALSLAPEADVLFMLALVLAQRAGERVSRAELRALIWPAACEESARHTLRQALYRLHKAGLVTEDRSEDIFLDPARVDSDLTRLLAGDWPEHAEPREIEAATTILPGVVFREQGALSGFIDSLRARAAAQYRRAVLRRIAATRREGRWREVEHWALMCLQADPLNEEATLARAESAAMVGAKHEALEVLEAYLKELGDRAKVIGLPARMLKRRISELADTSGRRVMATSAPFVGRHEQLARAQDALADARAGTASALWLIGPAGIGKSRLLRELERASKMAGWTVVRGGAHPSYADRPFALLTDMLPGLLDAPGALGAAPHALSLMRQMGTVKSDEEPLPPEEARGRQHAVYHSWVDLMDAVLGETALAILLDDVHWSDPLTLRSLARFLEGRPHARLAVILTTRHLPVREDGAAVRLLSAAQARLGPLSDEEMRDFAVGAGLAGDERFDEVTRNLGRASGGNPLFLSHLVHRHQSQRELTETPSDLASLIDGQLRALSREATRLLQACALLGQHSSLPRIERALGVGAPSLVSAFGELDDMLALPSDPGVPLAPHDLWTERVRCGMTSGVFRSLAVSVARVLEADAVSDGGIELSWDAARLYQESGEKQLAYATMMRCAEYLMRTGATAEASHAYLAASNFAVTPAAGAEALIGRVRALQAMAEWNQLLSSIERVRELDEQSDATIERPDLAILAVEASQFSLAVGTGVDTLIAKASDANIEPERRLHAAFVGMVLSDNIHDAATLRRFAIAADSVPRYTDDDIPRLRTALVFEGAIGSLSSAVAIAEDLIDRVRAQPCKAALLTALRTASFAFRRNGDYDRACSVVEESGVLAERLRFPFALFRSYDILAGLALEYGFLESAHASLLLAESHFTPVYGDYNRASLDISWLHWSIGSERWSDARDRILRIAPLDLTNRSRHYLLQAAAVLRVLMHDGRDDEARVILRAILGYGDTLFRHSSVDHIAVAVAAGLANYEGDDEARRFAKEFVTERRRDRMPPPAELTRYVR